MSSKSASMSSTNASMQDARRTRYGEVHDQQPIGHGEVNTKQPTRHGEVCDQQPRIHGEVYGQQPTRHNDATKHNRRRRAQEAQEVLPHDDDDDDDDDNDYDATSYARRFDSCSLFVPSVCLSVCQHATCARGFNSRMMGRPGTKRWRATPLRATYKTSRRLRNTGWRPTLRRKTGRRPSRATRQPERLSLQRSHRRRPTRTNSCRDDAFSRCSVDHPTEAESDFDLAEAAGVCTAPRPHVHRGLRLTSVDCL